MSLYRLYREFLKFSFRKTTFKKGREDTYIRAENDGEFSSSWITEPDTPTISYHMFEPKITGLISGSDWEKEFVNKFIEESTSAKTKLREQVLHLAVRQDALESTATDWVMGLDERVAKLENKNTLEIDNEKQSLRKNINNLSEIGQYQDNWNQYGAKKFSQELVFKCMQIITSTDLSFQPEIYPTLRRSIQLEYEPDRNHYLEIEVFDNSIKLYAKELGEENKKKDLSISDTIRELNDFQTRFRNSG